MEQFGSVKNSRGQWRTPPRREELRRTRRSQCSCKRKSVALLLAVLLGPVTYLYSWRFDKRVFVAGCAFSGLAYYAFASGGGFRTAVVVYGFIILSVLLRTSAFYAQYPDGDPHHRGDH